jgi:hypothetical protein
MIIRGLTTNLILTAERVQMYFQFIFRYSTGPCNEELSDINKHHHNIEASGDHPDRSDAAPNGRRRTYINLEKCTLPTDGHHFC